MGIARRRGVRLSPSEGGGVSEGTRGTRRGGLEGLKVGEMSRGGHVRGRRTTPRGTFVSTLEGTLFLVRVDVDATWAGHVVHVTKLSNSSTTRSSFLRRGQLESGRSRRGRWGRRCWCLASPVRDVERLDHVTIALRHHIGRLETTPAVRVGQFCRKVG